MVTTALFLVALLVGHLAASDSSYNECPISNSILANPSFEAPGLGETQYVQGTVQGWNASSMAGITRCPSGFCATLGDADGLQIAILQSFGLRDAPWLMQPVTFEAGARYQVSWLQRNRSPGENVYNNLIISIRWPSGAVTDIYNNTVNYPYGKFQSEGPHFFAALEPTGILELRATNPENHWDTTTLVDAVRLCPAGSATSTATPSSSSSRSTSASATRSPSLSAEPSVTPTASAPPPVCNVASSILLNPSFENPALPDSQGHFADQGDVLDWDTSTYAGFAACPSEWCSYVTGNDGRQIALLQSNPQESVAKLTQNVEFNAGARYEISWAQRTRQTEQETNNLVVSVFWPESGVTTKIYDGIVDAEDFVRVQPFHFIALEARGAVSFSATNPLGRFDTTTLVDAIALCPALPEEFDKSPLALPFCGLIANPSFEDAILPYFACTEGTVKDWVATAHAGVTGCPSKWCGHTENAFGGKFATLQTASNLTQFVDQFRRNTQYKLGWMHRARFSGSGIYNRLAVSITWPRSGTTVTLYNEVVSTLNGAFEVVPPITFPALETAGYINFWVSGPDNWPEVAFLERWPDVATFVDAVSLCPAV